MTEEERFSETREHFRDLKAIVVDIYKTSKLPKPIAITGGVLLALGYDAVETLFRMYWKGL